MIVVVVEVEVVVGGRVVLVVELVVVIVVEVVLGLGVDVVVDVVLVVSLTVVAKNISLRFRFTSIYI